MAKLPNISKQNSAHLKRVERFASLLQALFDEATNEYAVLAFNADYEQKAQFYFEDYPKLAKKAESITKDLAESIKKVVLIGTSKEWDKANDEVDSIVNTLLSSQGISADDKLKHFASYFNNHEDALKAFQDRTTKGLDLSDRVWNIAETRKIETQCALSIAQGKSAQELSRRVREELKEPHKLFRRVRDKYGELRLSKNAKAYHPGQGVYRSSYKNAMRLARTEINMAYRSAELERYDDLDFVVGFEVKRSTTGYACPVCEQLEGKYPKTFVFTGWHPHCRCYMVPILNTDEEFEKQNEAIMKGESYTSKSKNEVDDVPIEFREWIKDNKSRLDLAEKHGTEPFFIKDNEYFVDRVKEVKSQSLYVLRDEGYSVIIRDASDKQLSIEAADKSWLASEFSKADYVVLDREMTKAFEELGIYDDEIFRYVKYTQDKNELYVKFSGGGVTVARSFYHNGKDLGVYHNLFSIKENLQGRGTSRAVLGAFLEQYENMGVKEITLQANLEVGAYAWAQYGFKTMKQEVDYIISRAAYNSVLPKSALDDARRIVDDFYKHHSETEMFPMKYLSSQAYGKDLLMGESWQGQLDLTDKSALKMFKRYIYLR